TSLNSLGDIYFARSLDSGATWGAYLRVNTAASNQLFGPIVILDANGGLHFLWSDVLHAQAFYSYSADKGTSFSPEISIHTAVPSNNLGSLQALIDQEHAVLYAFAARDTGQMVMTKSVPASVLQVTKSHSGNFAVGQSATYNISVYNVAGAGPTA